MSEEHFVSDIIAALPLPTIGINSHERIFAMNPAAAELFGAAALGRHFVTALRQPALVEAVESCLQDKKARRAAFLAGNTGANTTFDVTLKAVENSGSLIASFQDVTQMAEASQMRRDFVANVSHELRTPLTALSGFIETLRGPAKDDTVARDRFLGIMAEEAGRMNRLVDDLLSLNRVESDERDRPTDQCDVGEVLQTAVCNLMPLAVDKDVSLGIDLGADPLIVTGDRDQLLQVFTNLVENAIKYGGAGNGVTIATESMDHDPALRAPGLRVMVTDRGPGIDPLHLPRLTERFYRADSHRSRSLGGTGLGLAIVKHILNRHRGRLRIHSDLGDGSTFTVILPRGEK